MRMNLDRNHGGILSCMDPMLRNFKTGTFIFVQPFFSAEKKEKTTAFNKKYTGMVHIKAISQNLAIQYENKKLFVRDLHEDNVLDACRQFIKFAVNFQMTQQFKWLTWERTNDHYFTLELLGKDDARSRIHTDWNIGVGYNFRLGFFLPKFLDISDRKYRNIENSIINVALNGSH